MSLTLPRTIAALMAAGALLQAADAAGVEAVTGAGARPARQRLSKRTSTGSHPRPAVYYHRNWGIDIVGVRPTASGLMLRFDYRVVDPDRAAVLTDHEIRPYLVDEASRTALAVPAMENVGELRQRAPLEPDRTYFMIFGNPGRVVKRGSRVTIMAGNFRAEGLVVQ